MRKGFPGGGDMLTGGELGRLGGSSVGLVGLEACCAGRLGCCGAIPPLSPCFSCRKDIDYSLSTYDLQEVNGP